MRKFNKQWNIHRPKWYLVEKLIRSKSNNMIEDKIRKSEMQVTRDKNKRYKRNQIRNQNEKPTGKIKQYENSKLDNGF